MLYFKCPTCRTVLANKQIPFEKGMNSICNNRTLTKEQQEKQKMELLDKLEMIRYCCRMRLISYVDLVDIVK